MRPARNNGGAGDRVACFGGLSGLFFGIRAGVRVSGRIARSAGDATPGEAASEGGARERSDRGESNRRVSVRHARWMEIDRAHSHGDVSNGPRRVESFVHLRSRAIYADFSGALCGPEDGMG